MNAWESISVREAEQLTGLPAALIEALANNERIPAKRSTNGDLHVSKMALLGWCRLYGRILNFVTRNSRPIYAGRSVFELVWMTKNGMLAAEEAPRRGA